VSVVNGIVADDLDKDGNKDLIIAGNFYPFRVQMGACDASIGLVLKGNGKGGFTPISYAETGLYLPGDIRNLLLLKGEACAVLVAAKNNDALQIVKIK
jgi:hypothetical protein